MHSWVDRFSEALQHFQRRDFKEASKTFRHTLKLRPDDGPSRFYLNLINQFRTRSPAKNWIGEVSMDEK